MSRAAPGRGAVALFLLKFSMLAPLLLGLWWWFAQPYYVEVAGQAAGFVIRYVAGLSLTGMKVTVDPSGVLNTKTSLVYLYGGRPVEIKVAFLVANLPAYLALILATGGLAWRQRLRALGLGGAILFAGHVAFLSIMFTFSREAQDAPEVPTAFGLFVMTLPFPLWIVLAYWDRAAAWMESASGERSKKQPPPGR